MRSEQLRSHRYIHVDQLAELMGFPEDAQVRTAYVEQEGEYVHVICTHTEVSRGVREVQRGGHTEATCD